MPVIFAFRAGCAPRFAHRADRRMRAVRLPHGCALPGPRGCGSVRPLRQADAAEAGFLLPLIRDEAYALGRNLSLP